MTPLERAAQAADNAWSAYSKAQARLRRGDRSFRAQESAIQAAERVARTVDRWRGYGGDTDWR